MSARGIIPGLSVIMLAGCRSTDASAWTRSELHGRALTTQATEPSGEPGQDIERDKALVKKRAEAVRKRAEKERTALEAKDVRTSKPFKLAEVEAHAETAIKEAEAGKVADAKASLKAAEEANKEADAIVQPAINQWLRLHAGAVSSSPFQVVSKGPGDPANGNPFKLERGSTSPRAYAEIDFLHRTAWLRPAERVQVPAGVPNDLELRLGFTSSQSSPGGVPAISTSTQAVSSDWYGEASLGWNIYRSTTIDDTESTKPRATYNIDLNGGFATDRDGIAVHGYYQAGPVAVWAVPVTMSDGTARDATIRGGLYAGIHEFVAERDTGGISSEHERPEFLRLGAIALAIDVTVPVSKGLDVIIGGRLTSSVTRPELPEDWSLFVGGSVNIQNLFQNLFGNGQSGSTQ